MTWFLRQMNRQEQAADATPQPVPIPTLVDQFMAGRKDYHITEDAWAQAERQRQRALDDLIEGAGGYDALRPNTPEDWRRWSNPKTAPDYVLERAQEAIDRDPAAWGARPRTREEFDKLVTDARRAELDEARAILSAGNSGAAEFLGQMSGALTDPIALPFWLVGGSPRLLGQFVAREAAIGGAIEAASTPRAQQVSEDLDLPDQNMAQRVLFGAAVGGAMAGAIGGAVRGVDYLRTRRQIENTERPADMDGAEYQAQVDLEERNLRAGTETATRAQPASTGPMPDDEIVSRIIGVESGGNATAQNPRSTARGLGQFIEGTWLQMINRHRPDLAVGRSRAQILQLRDDGPLNREMTRHLVSDNRQALQAAAVPTDPGALYLAHFMGSGGAVRALRAGDDVPITQLMDAAAIRANAPIRHNGKSFANFTAADLRSWASAKMGRPASGGRATAALDAERGGQFDLGTSRSMTRFDEVTTPAGTRVPVEYQVVDLDSLTPARGEFQPRDRSRGASDEQVSEIAARLDALRLMPSPEADRGAPIIGPDMMVESGNGRVMALRRAAEQHPDRYAAYVDAIRAQGFDVPEGMTRPALVAKRTADMTPDQRRAFVAEANDSGTMRMAASEQAGRDADFLTQNVFDAYQPGAPVATQGPFLRALLAQMPQSERAAMYGADGRLNADGLRRVRQALFSRAFGAPDLLRLLAESPDPRLRAMLDMLDDLAPDWAAFRAAVDGGFVKPEFDVTDPMIDMVRTIAQARTEGRDGQSVIAAIRDKLAQVDMFAAQGDDALSEALLRTFYKGDQARRPADAGDILRRYIADAQITGRADADDLFGPVRPAEILDQATRNHEAKTPAAPATAAPARAVPDTSNIVPAPMMNGAASPVLLRQAEDAQAALREAVAPSPAPTAPNRPADALPPDAAPTPAPAPDLPAPVAAAGEFDGLRDLTFRLDENGPELRVADVLDDLQANDDMAALLSICTRKG